MFDFAFLSKCACKIHYSGYFMSNCVLPMIPCCGFDQLWAGKFQGNDIVAKILKLRECTPRMSRDFKEEYPRLRY